VIDTPDRIDFLHYLLAWHYARYVSLGHPQYIAGGLLAIAISIAWPAAAIPLGLLGAVWITFLLRARAAYCRARATVEQFYRRQDVACKPWGNA
jgi:hypothetical protein